MDKKLSFVFAFGLLFANLKASQNEENSIFDIGSSAPSSSEEEDSAEEDPIKKKEWFDVLYLHVRWKSPNDNFSIFRSLLRSKLHPKGDPSEHYGQLMELFTKKNPEFHCIEPQYKDKGHTLLHIAALLGNENFLLAVANVLPKKQLAKVLKIKNNAGQTPMDCAAIVFGSSTLFFKVVHRKLDQE
jgi:hypothetical protein